MLHAANVAVFLQQVDCFISAAPFTRVFTRSGTFMRRNLKMFNDPHMWPNVWYYEHNGMNFKAYDLVEVTPKCPKTDASGGWKFHQPIPEDTVNMLIIAERNPKADARLRVDSKRLTEPQWKWLGEMTARS